jgi:hypothetical protein
MFQNRPMLKIASMFGCFAGISCIAYFVILNFLDASSLGLSKELNLGFIVIFVIFAILKFKKDEKNGYLHLWEGLSICYLIFLIAALINASFIYIYLSYFDRTVLDRYILENLTMLSKTKGQFIENFDLKTFQEILAKTKATSALEVWKDEIFKKMFWGVIISLPISIIFRKQDLGPMQEINRSIHKK